MRTKPTRPDSQTAPGRAVAIIYLRVSTKEQAEKGGQGEGYSIPAQRVANEKKARELDAVVVEEFVDAGESARKADRPALLRMLDYVKTHKVSYCIVHKVDRLARNRADDVAIHLALQEAGVMLVSASENIDETPSGMLLHGIMSTIAEFYSRNLATESIKGMTQKAKQGGTSTRAPIGYLNVGVRDKVGREVRTVIVDPERGHLVAWAFKAYASGNWTLSQLRRELTEQGLTTVPTPARPAKPISESGIHRVLTNPYYKGTVTFRGSTYRGNHEALIPPEVFYQVQAVLAAHTSRGDRTQVHDHYLKGLVYCGMCGSRMILTHAKSHTGSIYPYFICGGRHAKTTDCRMQATSVTKVEELIAEHYHTVELDARQQAATRQMVNAEYDALMAEAGKDLQALTARKQAIQAEQDRLLDAHLAGKVPLGVLGRKQDALQVELDTVTTDIAACKVDYAVQRTAVDDALALAIDPAAICHRAGPTVKRLLNDAFLRRVNLHQRPRDPHGTQERVAVEFELATPYDELLSAATIHRAEQWATTHTLTPQDALPTPGSPAAGLNIVHKGCSVAALPPTLPRSHGRVRRPAAFSPFRTHSVRVLAYGVSEPRPQAQGGAFEHVGYGV